MTIYRFSKQGWRKSGVTNDLPEGFGRSRRAARVSKKTRQNLGLVPDQRIFTSARGLIAVPTGDQ